MFQRIMIFILLDLKFFLCETEFENITFASFCNDDDQFANLRKVVSFYYIILRQRRKQTGISFHVSKTFDILLKTSRL